MPKANELAVSQYTTLVDRSSLEQSKQTIVSAGKGERVRPNPTTSPGITTDKFSLILRQFSQMPRC